MVLPARVKANPLEAFLGRTSVIDTYTREEEDVFEYVCRHTLLRPRDLMAIGERLVALRPDERRNEHRMMEAVNQAATDIAHEYLAEIAPYIGDLALERLFQALPGPVLDQAEVEAISEEHPLTAAVTTGASGTNATNGGQAAFHALYRVACWVTCTTIWCAANGASASCARAMPGSTRTACCRARCTSWCTRCC